MRRLISSNFSGSIFSHTRAPTSTDDGTKGLQIGSGWVDTSVSPPVLYVCTSIARGAATWQGSGGSSDLFARRLTDNVLTSTSHDLDTDLHVTLRANTWYELDIFVFAFLPGGTPNGAALGFQSVNASSSDLQMYTQIQATETSGLESLSPFSQVGGAIGATVTNGSTTDCTGVITVKGMYKTSSVVTNDFGLQIYKDTSSIGNPTLLAGSYVKFTPRP
jgi:hypothetical protein